MTSRFRRGLGSIGRRGSLLGVAVLATGLAARVVRTRWRGPAPTPTPPAPTGEGRPKAARPNRRTVTPKAGGGWTVSGGGRPREHRTQAEAEEAARGELLSRGGGELVIKGRDGKIRDQSTVGKADPRKSKG